MTSNPGVDWVDLDDLDDLDDFDGIKHCQSWEKRGKKQLVSKMHAVFGPTRPMYFLQIYS